MKFTLIQKFYLASFLICFFEKEEPYFFSGVTHGVFSVFRFVISLCTEDYYTFASNNIWYTFGFLVGCGAIKFTLDFMRDRD